MISGDLTFVFMFGVAIGMAIALILERWLKSLPSGGRGGGGAVGDTGLELERRMKSYAICQRCNKPISERLKYCKACDEELENW